MYSVVYSANVDKYLAKLRGGTRSRIEKAVREKLAINPHYHTRALSGKLKGYNRFRIGHYRLICRIKDKELLVLVVEADHRRSIYKQ